MIVQGPTQGPPPREYLQSVDLALNLILMLRDSGSLTISGAAETLGTAPSTVHRSMAMLVYRGFATRSESRTYLPGPAISSTSLVPGMGSELIEATADHLTALAAESGETCNLQVLAGNKTHFLYSAEGSQLVRVGTRRGQVMPADENSGGLAILAELSPGELRALYPTMPDEEFEDLRRTLHRTRTRGFALNHGLYEHDVSAVGAVLRNELGDTLGAITMSIPTTRFRNVHRQCADMLVKHVRDLNRRLAKFRPPNMH
ncbi:IclR family transcriptional regulator [Corynebacterium pilosum]|uniref:Transcriptional regulator n=1 Tax=Corynebacterium pilosum TaxID=35756 RepID=A0A376CND6_9CORY|nr:IclR family transcriptional regulator [Corynebacterium pilosum]STC70036.1 transcriptional regulator [Corynebacterium pilosum]